jgi:hypothetical protein
MMLAKLQPSTILSRIQTNLPVFLKLDYNWHFSHLCSAARMAETQELGPLGSWYAPLCLHDPGNTTPSGSGPLQPLLSSHVSIAPSIHVSIHPSHTASLDCLYVWEHTSSYLYKGRELSLNNMIAVLASAHGIPEKIANWVKDIVHKTVCTNFSLTYNTLGGKIYKHKDKYKPKVDNLEKDINGIHTGLAKKFKTINKETHHMQAKMDMYVQNNELCKQDIQYQHQDFNALYSNMQAMVQALNCMTKDNLDLCAHIEHLEKRMGTILAIPLVLFLAPGPVLAPVPIFLAQPAPVPLVPVTPVAPVMAPLVPIACLHTANR